MQTPSLYQKQKTAPRVRYIEDLPLLITLLAIRQKLLEASLWELIHSFLSLALAALVASRTLLQRLLLLNFTLDAEDLLCWYKQKR